MESHERIPDIAREAYEQALFEDMAARIVTLADLNLQIAKGLHRRQDIITELREAADYDDLTGLYSRKPFLKLVREQFVESRHHRQNEGQRSHSLLLLDLDDFKMVNDVLGHDEGDACLKYVAKSIREHTQRDNDYACRWGGEEFVIVLGDTEIDGAVAVAEHIQAAINVKIPGEDTDKPLGRLGATIAIAQFPQGSFFKPVFQAADESLLFSKKNTRGKNEIILAK